MDINRVTITLADGARLIISAENSRLAGIPGDVDDRVAEAYRESVCAIAREFAEKMCMTPVQSIDIS